MMPDRWCCPLCGHLNDPATGYAQRLGFCRSNACADRRDLMGRAGVAAVPEAWMALSFVSGKEWVEA